MSNTILVEIAGFKDSFCGPFPCDGDRTCDLEKCAPSEKLVNAVEALRERFAHIYGDKVEVRLTLLDDGIPDLKYDLLREQSVNCGEIERLKSEMRQ